jgi:hypothetical protein
VKDGLVAMKGNSSNLDYARELVGGANQYRQVLNPPWMLAVKTAAVVPL